MAWWLIVIGIVLIIWSIFQRIKFYRVIKEREAQLIETVESSPQESAEKADEKKEETINTNSADKEELEELTYNLQNILKALDEKEAKLRKVLKDGDDRLDSLSQESEEVIEEQGNNFEKIFNKTNDKINKEKLPEKYKQILLLARQEYSAQDIAEKLNLGIRETKLILKFHQRKSEADNSG